MAEHNAHIRELFEAHKQGALTTRALTESLDHENQEEILKIMILIAENTPPDPAFEQGEWESIIAEILSRRGARTRSIQWLARPRWRAAAAAVLILAATLTAIILLHTRNQQHQELAAQPAHDLAPGGNHATLTLSSGKKIILDSARTGPLASQGRTNIIKADSGALTYQLSHSPLTTDHSPQYNTLSTPRGGQYQLALPDGTKVWLNAASSITYPTAFTGRDRRVTMTGEAWFEAAPDKDHPFLVTVNDMEVAVLGTQFNINAYTDEGATRTTLLAGSVKVVHGRDASILSPGQQAQVTATGPVRIESGVNTDAVMAWKNGLFQFDNADIRTVMRQIARWYDVDVSYEGNIPTDHFQGKLPRDANASQVLRTLEKNQVHFRIEGRKIIIGP